MDVLDVVSRVTRVWLHCVLLAYFQEAGGWWELGKAYLYVNLATTREEKEGFQKCALGNSDRCEGGGRERRGGVLLSYAD